MKNYFRLTVFAVVTVMVMIALSLNAFASGDDVYTKLNDNRGGIMSVSRRGDTAVFPGNSLEAVESACRMGADMISVSVRKTSDDVLVLCEDKALSSVCDTQEQSIADLTAKQATALRLRSADGSVTDCKIVTLKKAIKKIRNKSVLILDNCWELRDYIYAFCEELDAFESVVLRTDVSSKEIADFCFGHTKISVIGIYDGNIVFNTQSHLKRLSLAGQPAVQYQSKNYFNVAFHSFTAKKYSSENNARAFAAMYNTDLCGKREDNISGWNEMIDRGFSVIETNCIGLLSEYICQCDAARQQLAALVSSCEKTDISVYSQVSSDNFSKALSGAKASLENKNTSLGRLEQNYSALLNTMTGLTLKTDSDAGLGNLNITAGKVAVVLIFGLLILAGEIYVHKMHAPGRKVGDGRKH